MPQYPHRIVCLTEETVETLYMLGEQDRIVGISGFTVRPPQARKEKPRVSAFTSAKIDKILALEPDLVLGFSDIQADIAAALIRSGVAVHVFNQRSVAEILQAILILGGLIGCAAKAEALVAQFEANIAAARQAAAQLPWRPKVYFEEWNEPQISCIQWVSELLAIAGADDIFPELAQQSLGKDRIIAQPQEVIRRAPDMVLGSWCGKRFRPEAQKQRPGWAQLPAVQRDCVWEIKSAIILQPGPAALSDGLVELRQRIDQAVLSL